jgi:hypothetical protein
VLQQIQANLTAIYTQIRDVAHYQGPLVALTYYSLSYSDPAQVAGTQLLDSVIASVTQAFGGKVADGFAAFAGPSAAFGGSPCAAGLLIKLPDGTCNIHPSPAGHLLLAQVAMSTQTGPTVTAELAPPESGRGAVGWRPLGVSPRRCRWDRGRSR